MFFAKSQKNIFALLENLDLASTQGVFGFQICFYMKKHWNVSVACAFRSHNFILFYVKQKKISAFLSHFWNKKYAQKPSAVPSETPNYFITNAKNHSKRVIFYFFSAKIKNLLLSLFSKLYYFFSSEHRNRLLYSMISTLKKYKVVTKNLEIFLDQSRDSRVVKIMGICVPYRTGTGTGFYINFVTFQK